MDLLFTYNQETLTSLNRKSTASLEVFGDETNMLLVFNFYSAATNAAHIYKINVNIKNGDFIVSYDRKVKKNDFKLLSFLLNITIGKIDHGKTQYKKSMDKISTLFYNKIKHNFNNEYYNKSLFNHKSTFCFLNRLIVNNYLDKRNIKSHNGVYFSIEDNFPAKKWLDRNNNNFLPSVLDSYGIKSKYFIKELNVNPNSRIYLKSLRYLCSLFGDNYIDYIKLIDWKECSTTKLSGTKIHTLKTDHEKKVLVKIINEFAQKDNSGKSIIQMIYNFMVNKDEMLKMKLDLNFKYNNIDSFYKTFEEINGILRHKKRGHRIRYTFPPEFLEMVENPIIIDNITFIPKVLLTEEDFIIEGHLMKNCMGQQFTHGIIFTYISLKSDIGTVNLQYQRGKLIQSRAKANSTVNDEFKPAIKVLSDKMINHQDIKWIKEKFDFI